jgi:diguanylate cyclase (GGDEF)-like protein
MTTPRGRKKNERTAAVRTLRKFWVAIVLVVLLAGTIGSGVEARNVARNDRDKSRQVFLASATEIGSTLQQAIVHEQDLSISTGAVLVRNPNATEADFLAWTRSVRAFDRYPEVQSIFDIQLVPASQLSSYAARQVADPSGPLAAKGSFAVAPAGSRPYYCLAAVARSRTTAVPDGIDYCQSALVSVLTQARDSGQEVYLPYKPGNVEELAIGAAIYRGGVVPGTVAARRAAIMGWTGTTIVPGVLLAAALAHHPATAVAFRSASDSSTVAFKAGVVPPGAQSTSIHLSNGWQVQVLGTGTQGGVLSNSHALDLLLGGITVSVLLALLLYVLGTSRARALELVAERTDELRHQAFHDPLTGLPNRALILDRIAQMMARARRERTIPVALFLDLDNFKDINDTLGHRSGDELLVRVGARLSGVLREGDTVGRLGGDEFVVLTEGATQSGGDEAVAGRILAVLEPSFEIAGSDVPLSITASIGIATGERTTPEELLRDADIALYRAKAAGKDRAEVFTPLMLESVDDHRSLDVDLHRALGAEQFFLLYQPTFDLSSGTFTGVEALLRWRHPIRGVVQPDDIIPALEASGLIVPVGQWVLETACRQGATWHGRGHRFVVSVNVAAKQLQRDRIVDDVYRALSTSGFDAGSLVLELTESALMQDVDTTVTRLKMLKAIGVRLAIDDFGTGFSSLAYLQQFPIDILKIDRSFVSGIGDAEKSAAIVRTFVQLGRALGLEVIAEGIETDVQRRQLEAADVDTGQGFLLARPLEAGAVDQLLLDSGGFLAETVGAGAGETDAAAGARHPSD